MKTARENGERHAPYGREARALHKRGSCLRRFAPSEKVRKRSFCSLNVYLKYSFPLFQWHACNLAKLSTRKTKCMITLNTIYIFIILH